MITCTSCGGDVTGKKFCPQCGTPVQQSTHLSSANEQLCPRCNGAVKPGAAFCMHCGSVLSAPAQTAQVVQTAPPPPSTLPCPSCHAQIPVEIAFCTNCGHNMHAPVATIACPNCGRQNGAGIKFCGGCGAQIAPAQPAYQPPPQYPQQPQQPYQQQQYPQQYPQGGYPAQQPMLGQQQMVLRCPTCMAMAPMGTQYCLSCRTSLAGVVPTPAYMPAQGQQGGLGGFLQGSGGQMAVGALGGAAAVIGGEMLLHGIERRIEDRVEDDMGYDGRHHHRDEGLLGNLGELSNDIGLF